MPDDPALAFGDVMLGSLDTEILVVTTSLFDSGIKHNEIVNQLQKALLTADSAQVKIEFMLIGIGNFFFFIFSGIGFLIIFIELGILNYTF